MQRFSLASFGFFITFLTSLSAGAQVTSLENIFSDIEIGKEGSCAGASYTSIAAQPIEPYAGKRALLSSQLIGSAGIQQVLFAQQSLYQPYIGVSFLPNKATLPQFTTPLDSSKLYRITYTSSGKILSGLVVVPDHSISNGIVVYDHATQVTKEGGAPSYPSSEACLVITALTGKGRILAIPDYIGYGVNNGEHPYPLGIGNAPSGIDIIVAAHELAAAVNRIYPVGSALAVTGYSEGGGNSFWLAREIAEENPDLMGSKLSMIAPMSGAYDMTGATAHSLIVRQPGVTIPSDINELTTFLVKPLLVAYGTQAAKDYSLSSLSTMLKPPFLEFVQGSPLPIATNNPQGYLGGLVVSFALSGYTLLNPNPSMLMQVGFINAIKTTDISFPAIALWSANDNISWAPKDARGANIPTYITGILQDEIIPFAGSNYPVPSGYTAGKPIFAQGNSQNLIRNLRGQGVGPSYLAWCGMDANKKPTNLIGREVMVRINHLTGLPAGLMLAAKAIETGTLANLPTIPDPN